jgi:hypothetical protein
MKSTDYIKSFINNIIEVFPTIKCSYGFDNLDNTHTIEIIPSVFFDTDNDFRIMENKFYDDFFNLYPNEIVYLITEHSPFPVSNPLYTKSGLQFNDISKGVVSYSTSNIVINENSLNIYTNNKLTFNPLDVKVNCNISLGAYIYLKGALLSEITSNAGEGNYALAA